ncbi:MAG TPA: hypothetical protein VIL46_11735 [Gemmataceae bacterium]
MSTAIHIYSKQSSPALEREGRAGLEDDLDEFLGEAGETTGGGSGVTSEAWNVDLELFDDTQLEEWIERLTHFLREWGVPEDTYFKVFPEDWVGGTEPRRVNVFPDRNPA